MMPTKGDIEVSCKVNLGQISSRTAMLFQIGEADVPDGIQYAEIFVMLNQE